MGAMDTSSAISSVDNLAHHSKKEYARSWQVRLRRRAATNRSAAHSARYRPAALNSPLSEVSYASNSRKQTHMARPCCVSHHYSHRQRDFGGSVDSVESDDARGAQENRARRHDADYAWPLRSHR